MRNLFLLSIFFSLFITAQQSFAAFPLKAQNATAVTITEGAKSSGSIPVRSNKSASADNTDEKESSLVSILSLTCGVFSIILTYFFAFKSGYIDVGSLIAGGLLGLGAIGFGDVGTGRKLKGLAYTGAILGMISVVPITIYALGALIVAFFSGNL